MLYLRLRSFSDHIPPPPPPPFRSVDKKKAVDSFFIIGGPRLWNELPADLREAVLAVFPAIVENFPFPTLNVLLHFRCIFS